MAPSSHLTGSMVGARPGTETGPGYQVRDFIGWLKAEKIQAQPSVIPLAIRCGLAEQHVSRTKKSVESTHAELQLRNDLC